MDKLIILDGPSEWELRDSAVMPLINFHGKYNYPVIHRGNCDNRYPTLVTDCPAIGEEGLMEAWKSEVKRRSKGLKSLEFCEHCVCVEVK